MTIRLSWICLNVCGFDWIQFRSNHLTLPSIFPSLQQPWKRSSTEGGASIVHTTQGPPDTSCTCAFCMSSSACWGSGGRARETASKIRGSDGPGFASRSYGSSRNGSHSPAPVRDSFGFRVPIGCRRVGEFSWGDV